MSMESNHGIQKDSILFTYITGLRFYVAWNQTPVGVFWNRHVHCDVLNMSKMFYGA